MSDSDRQDWVNNLEDLYLLWKRSGIGLRRWVRANRELIDSVIRLALQPR